MRVEIRVAENAGFCFGVKRAYDLALHSTQVTDGPLYSWGPLIHNPQVVHRLAEEGLRVISDLDEVGPGASVVIRSHGVPPAILEALEKRGARVIDATCPFVKKAENKLSQLEKEGYQVLLLGDRGHAEVQTLISYARSNIEVITGPGDLESLSLQQRVGILSQTTQREAILGEVVNALLSRVPELKVFNTICDFTKSRIKAALDLAMSVDLLLIVGGKNSANTKSLMESCRGITSNLHQIETPEEIDPSWLEHINKVGVATGASTPDWIISEVMEGLKSLVGHGAEQRV